MATNMGYSSFGGGYTYPMSFTTGGSQMPAAQSPQGSAGFTGSTSGANQPILTTTDRFGRTSSYKNPNYVASTAQTQNPFSTNPSATTTPFTPSPGSTGTYGSNTSNVTSYASSPFANLQPQLATNAGAGLTAGQSILNTAADPQNALYDRTAQRLQDQVRVGEAARGTTTSPYGAGVENQAMSNFNIDWQNQQLNRQLQGIQGNAAAMAPARELYGMGGTTTSSTSGYDTRPNPQQQPQGGSSSGGGGGSSGGGGMGNEMLPLPQSMGGYNSSVLQQPPTPQPVPQQMQQVLPRPQGEYNGPTGLETQQGLNYNQIVNPSSFPTPDPYGLNQYDLSTVSGTGGMTTDQLVGSYGGNSTDLNQAIYGGGNNFGGMGISSPNTVPASASTPPATWDDLLAIDWSA